MIGDGKLLASAAWDAQSLNELKAKAGQDGGEYPSCGPSGGRDVCADDAEKYARGFTQRWFIQQ